MRFRTGVTTSSDSEDPDQHLPVRDLRDRGFLLGEPNPRPCDHPHGTLLVANIAIDMLYLQYIRCLRSPRHRVWTLKEWQMEIIRVEARHVGRSISGAVYSTIGALSATLTFNCALDDTTLPTGALAGFASTTTPRWPR